MRCVWAVTVLLWTVIVLALAIHFHGILLTNDLSECLTLASGVGSMKERKAHMPTSTIHSFRYLRLRRDNCPAPRLVRPFSFYITIAPGSLTRVFCKIALRSQESQPDFDEDRTRMPRS